MNQKSVHSREWRWVKIGDQMQQRYASKHFQTPMDKQEILLRHVTHAFVWDLFHGYAIVSVCQPSSFLWDTGFKRMRLAAGTGSCSCIFPVMSSNHSSVVVVVVVVVAAPCTAIQDNMQIHKWHMQDATICLHGWGKTSYNIWLGSCNLAEADQVLSLGNTPLMPHPSPPWLSRKDI